MKVFRLGRGKKANVRKFRPRDGLCIIAIVLVGMVVIVVLFQLGIFQLDAH